MNFDFSYVTKLNILKTCMGGREGGRKRGRGEGEGRSKRGKEERRRIAGGYGTTKERNKEGRKEGGRDKGTEGWRDEGGRGSKVGKGEREGK